MFFAPFFFIELFTPSHVKIKFTRCCCCIVLHICIPAYKPYILFFFFYFLSIKIFTTNQPNQPPQFWLSQNFIHFYKRREDWLPKKIFQLTTDKGGKQQQQQQKQQQQQQH